MGKYHRVATLGDNHHRQAMSDEQIFSYAGHLGSPLRVIKSIKRTASGLRCAQRLPHEKDL
jgi:hypothetical protein